MKNTWIAALLLGLLPAVTFAGDRFDRGGRYDRGDRYRDTRSSSRNFFGLSFGFGSRDFFGGVSYRNYDYPTYRAERIYVPAPVYYAPPPVVVYREPAYCPPPAVVYSPAPSYYYAPPVVTYSEPRYYYGR